MRGIAAEDDGQTGEESGQTDAGTASATNEGGAGADGEQAGQAAEAGPLRDAVGQGPLRGRRPPGDQAENLLPMDVKDEDLAAVYVRPGEYDHARQALADHRVVVLQGRPGSGRHAMARYLLLHDLGVEQIDELSPDTEPGRIKPRRMDSGHLLERWRPAQAERLHNFHLREWNSTLDHWRGYLVVTVDHDVPVLPGEASGQLVECASVPDLRRVLERHLDLYLHARNGRRLRDEYRAWLGSDKLRRHLHRKRELRSTIQLARRLTRQVDAAPTPDRLRLLDQWFDDEDVESPEPPAKRQLEKSKDVEHWSLVIALAVYDGGRYHVVADAAGLLARRLAPGDPRNAAAWQPGPARAERLQQAGDGQYHVVADAAGLLARRLAPGDPRNAAAWQPGPARAERLQQAGAELFDAGESAVPLIRTPVPRVQFKDPALASAVLDHVWNELDELRGPVRDWLDALGGDRDLEVRERAAAAVGYLASHGFGYVLDLIIEPWAMRGRTTREAAALALGALARHERFTDQVLDLLSRWARGPDGVRRETAAIAYGWSIGRREPAIALRELRALARRDAVLLPTVAEALYELVRRWRDREVLEALGQWTKRPARTTWAPAERRMVWTGLAAFLLITHLYEEARPPRKGLWPVLLVLAEEDPDARERIVALWRRALADDYLAEAAGTKLCVWAREADLSSSAAGDEQPDLTVALRGLLMDVASGGPADAGRVRQAVKRCAYAREDPSDVARKLADELA